MHLSCTYLAHHELESFIVVIIYCYILLYIVIRLLLLSSLSSLPLEGGRGVHPHLKACNGPQHHISNGARCAEAEGQPRLACHLVQPKNMC